MKNSGAGLGQEDDLDQFMDALTFSFGSFNSTDMTSLPDKEVIPCTVGRGVKFNPVVNIMGGSAIPLAAGDGFWDTLQYEHVNARPSLVTQGSTGSLSMGDLVGEEESTKSLPTGLEKQQQGDAMTGLQGAATATTKAGLLAKSMWKRFDSSDDDHTDDMARTAVNNATSRHMERESSRHAVGAFLQNTAARQTLQ
jgi:hypothetical protein